MPFQYSSDLRRRTPARLLTGESVKSLAAELSVTGAALHGSVTRAMPAPAGSQTNQRSAMGRSITDQKLSVHHPPTLRECRFKGCLIARRARVTQL
jgi:hypothetical protein